jgi:hypothetical protein
MAKFRSKPREIEAWPFDGDRTTRGICNTVGAICPTEPHVHTMHQHQPVVVEVGDMITPEPDGTHFYPIKPEALEANYEPVEEEEDEARD